MISEEQIIQVLQKASCGFIGDDAAVLPHVGGNNRYLMTQDLLVEDVHFRVKYFTPRDLAHKALHVNLSDLAAMGAEPRYILCGISIPEPLQDYACAFLDALTLSCQEVGVILIGGDTTASREHLLVSITAIGLADDRNIKYRNQASHDDKVCIVGNLGFAHLGWVALENGLVAQEKYIRSFLCPNAKIKEGIWLGKHPAVTSMMDISDGLYIDLKRLCTASNKRAVIDVDCLQACLDPEISVQVALEGGEDYGLLVTVNPEALATLSTEFFLTFGYDLKVVGHMTVGNGIAFKKGNQDIALSVDPFTHFGEK